MKISLKFFLVAALAGIAAAAHALPEVGHAVQAVIAFVGPQNLASLAFMGSVATTVVQGDTYTGKHPVNTQPRAAEVLLVAIPITFPVAAPVANDIHVLTKLLPNVQVIDWDLILDDIDTNGAPAASLSLGEVNAAMNDVTVLYKNAITIGQTGGLLRNAAASAATDVRAIGAATLANERIIGLKWDTAAATYAASKTGLLILKVIG